MRDNTLMKDMPKLLLIQYTVVADAAVMLVVLVVAVVTVALLAAK